MGRVNKRKYFCFLSDWPVHLRRCIIMSHHPNLKIHFKQKWQALFVPAISVKIKFFGSSNRSAKKEPHKSTHTALCFFDEKTGWVLW